MERVGDDLEMRLIRLFVRGMYAFLTAYFAYGFWSAKEVFYSPPIVVAIVAYLGLFCSAAMLGLFGILIFAKQPGVTLAKLFSIQRRG